MTNTTNVSQVRNAVVQHVGSKVKIRSNKGRHKVDVTEGIISEAYPCIFLVKVQNDMESMDKMISFSYADLLTKDVQLTLCASI